MLEVEANSSLHTLEEVRKLLAHGLDWKKTYHQHQSIVHMFLDNIPVLSLLASYDAVEVIHQLGYLAVRADLREIATMALNRGWNPHQHPVPLMLWELETSSEFSDAMNTYSWLLEELQLDPKQTHPVTGQTALFGVNNPDVVHYLVSRGVNPLIQCRKGNTALMCRLLRIRDATWSTIQALLSYGGVDAQNIDGWSPRTLLKWAYMNRTDVTVDQAVQDVRYADKRDKLPLV